VQDVLPMDNPWHYRHLVRLHAQHGPQGTVLGNYRSKSHTIYPLTTCSLLPVEFPAILTDLSRLLDTYGDEYPLKEAVVRKGRATEDILLLLKTEGLNQTGSRAIWSELRTLHPNLVGIVVQSDGAAAGLRGATVIGQNFYSEIVSGIRFHIPATAFFQNNPKQTEALLQQVKVLCEPAPSEHLLDLYCGAGLFTHYLARDYKLVTGIEENNTAVTAARENAEINNNSNTAFRSGRVEKILVRIAKSGPAPDTIILDPPRQGCLPGAIAGIAALSPKRIVYVSCNPATLARDLALLVKQNYHLQVVQPIDMFPHTYHIECVAKIERR
jgi:23S rRNA (uracil1939-C5)-methyltransferase